MLLQKDRKKRLGQKSDVKEIIAHPFFNGLDFDKLIEKKIVPKFIPSVDETGLNNFDQDITGEKPDESLVPQNL